LLIEIFQLKKIYSIVLIMAFFAVIIQPVIPFVQYYYALQEKSFSLQPEDCSCACEQEQTAKMASNGDAYLKALLKRVCNDKKKENPQIPVVNIPVFVKTLYSNRVPVYTCPGDNYNEISDFIILPPLSSYNQELFRPPQLS